MLSGQNKNNAIESQHEEQIVKGQTTLLSLKQYFDENKQFPAMGNSISQLMHVSNENGGTQKLADIILQDQSLTSKILSIVNSSSYNQFGGEINTISRAVVILGLDQIQSISLSIMVFEKLNKGPMAEALKSYACQSFLSAYFSKKLVEEIQSINSEEAFLVSMFHNLGKQTVLYFFPEKYTEISNLILEQELDEDSACIEILGLDFTDIGQYMAIELKLPKNIILGIQAKPKIIKKHPAKMTDYLAQISSLTNEILETAACGDNELADQKLEQIIKRYKISFTLDHEKIIRMLTSLSQILLNYCGVLGINPDENTFCKNLVNFVNSQQEIEEEAEI
jgi:eukaryotic-like serine/threonine-protein kinase